LSVLCSVPPSTSSSAKKTEPALLSGKRRFGAFFLARIRQTPYSGF
jgi:hypothetical protein